MVIKYCIVPPCTNNSYKDPKKIFIYVPIVPDIRRKWYEAIRAGDETPPKTKMLFCCEDHFNLETDVANWMQYKTIGSKLVLKKDIVPHLNIDAVVETMVESQLTSSARKRKAKNIKSLCARKKLNFDSPDKSASVSTETKYITSPSGRFSIESVVSEVQSSKNEKCIQVNLKKKTRNRGSTANLKIPGVELGIQVKICPCYNKTVKEISPGTTRLLDSPQTPSSISTVISTESGSNFSSDTTINKLKQIVVKQDNLKVTLGNIKSLSRFYLGLPESEYFLINLMANSIKISSRNIMICLKKIRLNDPYVRLGIDFGLSDSAISKIFIGSIFEIANTMQDLIHWPTEFIIKFNLPTQFVTRYKHVQSIIDCLEIEIEQPTSAIHQAQTWSQYKK